MSKTYLRTLCASAAAAALLTFTSQPVLAHNAASELSAVSMLPVAVVIAAPAALLSGGAMLTVAAVEVSAEGTVWVLERASDGARASVKLAGQSAMAVGTGIAVTAISAGWLLSAAGQAIAFIPNEVGASLLYNERVTR
ncbi:hypothetical protein HLB44_21485 [Aquincola sp. S2]|uniref:Uncharacterized protein n=1 Tax=Pseudaquabacterium terrae TaxID=2732868 RepID=A0ABX2ELY3_9BURK|nr:hypothetical protein [Aquabacterium terrae]NRF69580.1 hypothetical protein [Aquabacterium terrae]